MLAPAWASAREVGLAPVPALAPVRALGQALAWVLVQALGHRARTCH